MLGRFVIEVSRSSLRLLLLCRSNFLDVIDIKRDRRGNTAKPYGDHTVFADPRDGAREQDATAFFNLSSHSNYMGRQGARTR